MGFVGGGGPNDFETKMTRKLAHERFSTYLILLISNQPVRLIRPK